MTVGHGKNDFAEGPKILLDTDLKIILDHQNNFVGILKISNTVKNFASLATNLSVLHHYFDKSNLFSDLYPANMDFSVKPFFLRI